MVLVLGGVGFGVGGILWRLVLGLMVGVADNVACAGGVVVGWGFVL